MLYTYYGDDFTGSTDVLEQLGSYSIPSVLFIGVPTPQHAACFNIVQAVGIAGDSRTRSPEWMTDNLPAVYRALQQFGAPVNHYKVCSTFDSSPTHGNIARAIQIGIDVLHPEFVPIVVGAPHLRRYVCFGNLFAAAPDGTIQRIDRHPMSRHPVTPMLEADLRRYLAAQGMPESDLIDIPALNAGNAPGLLDAYIAERRCPVILFDTVDENNRAAVGELIWHRAQKQPIFTASSSGLTAALVDAWRSAGLIGEHVGTEPLPYKGPLLVVSGSCSVATERQLRYAIENGYETIPIEPADLINGVHDTRKQALDRALTALANGRDTVLYTALGAPAAPAHGDQLGIALGNLLRELLDRGASLPTPIGRVVVCGGDTSSHAVQQLGIYALTWAANIAPGGPLCRAHSDGPLDGLEIVLKGGQVGKANFFDLVRGS
jgi:uncharacterized protein YgbK (DUF1537 family)